MKQYAAIIVLLAGSFVAAGVIRLKDGRTLQGDIRKSENGYTITDDKGTTIEITADNLAGIEMTNTKPGPGAARERFDSLKRAIDSGRDPKIAIVRYQEYIKQFANEETSNLATKEIAIWQDRSDRRLVKWNNQWLSTEELTQVQQRSLARAEDARQLLLKNRSKDAEPILQQALIDDPGNPVALYLRAIILYQQEQLGPARKSFEAVAGTLNDHAPTLNNLGAILFRQKRPIEALRAFVDALNASPKNTDILSNIAETLHVVSEADRRNDVYVRATRRFAEQDKVLQAEHGASGWVRWGSGWVSQAEYDRLAAQAKEINQKIAALAKDYDDTQSRIRRIDDDIRACEREIYRIQTWMSVRDVNGIQIRTVYPLGYRDNFDTIDRLRDERKTLVDRADQLDMAAGQLRRQLPSPEFSGVMHFIGVEGAPSVKLAGASTQPTSQPSTQPVQGFVEGPATQPAQSLAPPTTEPAQK